MKKVKIRKAKKQDVDTVAHLIYYTEVNPHDVWGGDSKQECLENLKELIKDEESRYSLNYIMVAEMDEKVLGVIVLIPYDELDRLSLETEFKQFKRVDGLLDKLYFIFNDFKYIFLRECRRGDLYIANIATSKEARGLGIGKKLMKYAEQVAKKEEYEGISLLAKDENVTKFYEKLDYNKVFDKVLFGERIIKMVKCF